MCSLRDYYQHFRCNNLQFYLQIRWFRWTDSLCFLFLGLFVFPDISYYFSRYDVIITDRDDGRNYKNKTQTVLKGMTEIPNCQWTGMSDMEHLIKGQISVCWCFGRTSSVISNQWQNSAFGNPQIVNPLEIRGPLGALECPDVWAALSALQQIELSLSGLMDLLLLWEASIRYFKNSFDECIIVLHYLPLFFSFINSHNVDVHTDTQHKQKQDKMNRQIYLQVPRMLLDLL